MPCSVALPCTSRSRGGRSCFVATRCRARAYCGERSDRRFGDAAHRAVPERLARRALRTEGHRGRQRADRCVRACAQSARRVSTRRRSQQAAVVSRGGDRGPCAGLVRSARARADAPAVELADIVAFVNSGPRIRSPGRSHRLGPRLLRRHFHSCQSATLRIGLAFECQLLDAVPREPHDARLHYVVTEAAIYRAAD